MKLMYQDSILEFEVPRDKVTVVSFENRKVFRRMVTELDIQCDSGEGPWILNDNDKAFNLDKYGHIILNPLYIDVNSKSLLTKLQNQLTKEALLMTEEVADIVNRLHAFYQNMLSRQLRLVCLTTGSFDRENLDKNLINGYILDNDFCII